MTMFEGNEVPAQRIVRRKREQGQPWAIRVSESVNGVASVTPMPVCVQAFVLDHSYLDQGRLCSQPPAKLIPGICSCELLGPTAQDDDA